MNDFGLFLTNFLAKHPTWDVRFTYSPQVRGLVIDMRRYGSERFTIERCIPLKNFQAAIYDVLPMEMEWMERDLENAK